MKCAILYRKPTSQEVAVYKRGILEEEVFKKGFVALYFLLLVGVLWGGGAHGGDERNGFIVLGLALLIYDIRHIHRGIKCYRQYQGFKQGRYEVGKLEIDNERFIYKDMGKDVNVVGHVYCAGAYKVPGLECEAVVIRDSYELIYKEQKAMLIRMPKIGRAHV